MKKIFAVIPIAILIILLFSDQITHAATIYGFLVRNSANMNDYWYICSSSPITVTYRKDPNSPNGRYFFTFSSTVYYGRTLDTNVNSQSLNDWIDDINNNNVWVSYSTFDSGYGWMPIIANGFTLVPYSANDYSSDTFDSIEDYEDYINPPPPEPSWWESMWDELGSTLGDPNFWFGEWFIDIIDNVFGNDDEGGGPSQHSITSHVQIADPTLTPAPTPIPFTTVVIPKTDPVSGDTYYETNYYYNNPSGTPIIQPYPPTNSPSTTSSPNSPEYIPVGGDPYSIPVVNWLTSTTIGDTNYDGIDSVGSGLDSIDTIGSEYNDGMGAVQDATGTLPTSWLLLIGIAAAIPLIAGIISRFLS